MTQLLLLVFGADKSLLLEGFGDDHCKRVLRRDESMDSGAKEDKTLEPERNRWILE